MWIKFQIPHTFEHLIWLISGANNVCLPYGGICDTSFDNERCIPRPCTEKCLFSHQCGSDDNICYPKPCNDQRDCYPSESCSKILSGSRKELTSGCIPNGCKRDSGEDDNHYWNYIDGFRLFSHILGQCFYTILFLCL